MPTTVPKYEKVMNDLRRRIAEGEFEPTGRLPSTRQLVDHYGFSRETIRQAITRMQMLGELQGEQGDAVYVVKKDEAAE
ncbi:MAG TPA: GntR family transcriptional regulator [Nocardioidaceae bacterium]|jgi:DNA-binding GntR family transcriptional regulator